MLLKIGVLALVEITKQGHFSEDLILKFPLAPMGVLALRLRTLDVYASPYLNERKFSGMESEDKQMKDTEKSRTWTEN
jgi:hypothetical protein